MKNYGPYPYQERSLSNLPEGKPRRQPWTDGEIATLVWHRARGYSISRIAVAMGRTYYSVQSQIAKGGF